MNGRDVETNTGRRDDESLAVRLSIKDLVKGLSKTFALTVHGRSKTDPVLRPSLRE